MPVSLRPGGRAVSRASGSVTAMLEMTGFADSFVAIDFETANANRGSACSVGLAFVEDGRIIGAEEHLMRPPATVDYFEPFNVGIHGITPGMVRSKPRFGEIMPDLLDRIGDRTVVAHNASFDINVLWEACHLSNLDEPYLIYLCTKIISRTMFNLGNYKLPSVARALNLVLEDHHNAKADAICTAEIMLALCDNINVSSLEELRKKQKVRSGYLDDTGWDPCERGIDVSDIIIPDPSPYANPGNPVYDKHFTITGKLPFGYTRRAIYQMISTLGGYSQHEITLETDYLIIGGWETNKPLPNANHANQIRRAKVYNSRGQTIEIISGRDLLSLLSEAQGFER